MSEYSIIDLMKNDFTMESLQEAKKQTKQSKAKIDEIAGHYNVKYHEKIKEGTRKRQLMLEQAGIKDGTQEAENFFKMNEVFMPTVQTPIMNMLYFLNEEYGIVDQKMEKLKKQYEERYGHLTEKWNPSTDMNVLGGLADKHGKEIDNFETEDTVPHMEKYIYQNMDASTFGKLKKLKALSKSGNETEAKAAWLKCMDICEHYGLEFEDIPCKYD